MSIIPVEEEKNVIHVKLQYGEKVYQLNLKDDWITELQTVINIQTHKHKVNTIPGCMYCVATNYKGAQIKFQRMCKEEIKKHQAKKLKPV